MHNSRMVCVERRDGLYGWVERNEYTVSTVYTSGFTTRLFGVNNTTALSKVKLGMKLYVSNIYMIFDLHNEYFSS